MFGRDQYFYVVPAIVFGTLTFERAISTIFVLTARLNLKQLQLFGALSIVASIFALITGVSVIAMGDAGAKQNDSTQKTTYLTFNVVSQAANSILTILLYFMLFVRLPIVMKTGRLLRFLQGGVVLGVITRIIAFVFNLINQTSNLQNQIYDALVSKSTGV
ncbi:hypothetical protein HDV06_004510 [Boothiomyces sp. JEL0866]|nr:hypothetical protein HDV06_004510 [Boothiomyces sp. JEL0866]